VENDGWLGSWKGGVYMAGFFALFLSQFFSLFLHEIHPYL
jgi:hypothetical protein